MPDMQAAGTSSDTTAMADRFRDSEKMAVVESGRWRWTPLFGQTDGWYAL